MLFPPILESGIYPRPPNSKDFVESVTERFMAGIAKIDGLSVFLVEDDTGFAEITAAAVSQDSACLWLGHVTSGKEALSAIPALNPRVVLMDICLPDASGVELVSKVRESSPQTEIIMLTVFEDVDSIFRSLANGARGYMVKNTAGLELIRAIKEVAAGGAPMSPSIARRLMNEVFPGPETDSRHGLTPREWEILVEVSKGGLNKQIANGLKISPETVRAHLYNIYKKLEVKTRGQAIRKVWPSLFGLRWKRPE